MSQELAASIIGFISIAMMQWRCYSQLRAVKDELAVVKEIARHGSRSAEGVLDLTRVALGRTETEVHHTEECEHGVPRDAYCPLCSRTK